MRRDLLTKGAAQVDETAESSHRYVDNQHGRWRVEAVVAIALAAAGWLLLSMEVGLGLLAFGLGWVGASLLVLRRSHHRLRRALQSWPSTLGEWLIPTEGILNDGHATHQWLADLGATLERQQRLAEFMQHKRQGEAEAAQAQAAERIAELCSERQRLHAVLQQLGAKLWWQPGEGEACRWLDEGDLPAEVATRQWTEIVAPNDRAEVEAGLGQLQKSRRLQWFRHGLRRGEGYDKVLHAVTYDRLEAEGEPLFFGLLLSDPTVAKQASGSEGQYRTDARAATAIARSLEQDANRIERQLQLLEQRLTQRGSGVAIHPNALQPVKAAIARLNATARATRLIAYRILHQESFDVVYEVAEVAKALQARRPHIAFSVTAGSTPLQGFGNNAHLQLALRQIFSRLAQRATGAATVAVEVDCRRLGPTNRYSLPAGDYASIQMRLFEVHDIVPNGAQLPKVASHQLPPGPSLSEAVANCGGHILNASDGIGVDLLLPVVSLNASGDIADPEDLIVGEVDLDAAYA